MEQYAGGSACDIWGTLWHGEVRLRPARGRAQQHTFFS